MKPHLIMNQEICRQLLNRYFSGELTSPEKASLNEMINDPLYEDTLDAVVKEIMLSDDYGEIDNPAIKARIDAWLDIRLQHEKEEETTEAHTKLVPFKRRRVRLWTRVAAAAIILLLGAGSYFFFDHISQRHIGNSAEPSQDVAAPASDHAVITLANGKQIALDSAGNGLVANQGNVKLTKLANGQIAYAGVAAELSYNTIFNPRGSQPVHISLADGSIVWLNAESSLRYPVAFTGGERKVEVTGEAYFEVSHILYSPFVVQRGDMKVIVLGTHFNVNTYDDDAEIKVTLLEGRVKVSKGNKEQLLSPGEQALLTGEDGIRLMNNADLEETMAWKNGKFSCRNMDLSAIMRQVARWYNVDVVYKDSIPDRYTVNISRDVPVSNLFRFLELSGGVHFKIEEKKITVLK
jgi:transmembrane sensor